MCESTAYLLQNGVEELFFKDVDALTVEGDEIKLVDIFGDTKTLTGRVKQFSLVDHKIFLEPLGS